MTASGNLASRDIRARLAFSENHALVSKWRDTVASRAARNVAEAECRAKRFRIPA
jgi:hypothetical protein